MSKTFTNQQKEIHALPKLVRYCTISFPCTVCKKNTQEDPFSKYFFGLCCSECASHINRYVNKKIGSIDDEDTKKLIFAELAEKLSH